MCSAINEQEMILKAIALGARDYVVKPFRAHRVLRALRKAIGLDAA
jgi:two-component system chemotaxis response regulator CheY